MSDHIRNPSTAYRAFLANLIRTREERGFSIEHLAQLIGLTPEELRAFEAGEKQLGLHDARKWLIALDLPFTQWRDGVRVGDADEPQIMKSDIPDHENNLDAPTSDISTPLPASTIEPEVPSMQVLYFAPGKPPEVKTIPNTLRAMQQLVGGLMSAFETDIPGTIGVANDEGIVNGMDFNRYIPGTGAQIFGPFFVLGDTPEFRSLTPLELETVLDALAPELSQSEFRAIMLTHDQGKEWVENWE
jgi:transcriptional regulator with XRE-family HTH domain